MTGGCDSTLARRVMTVLRWRSDLEALDTLMGLILPAFVLATVAILLWSVVASQKQAAEPASRRERLAVGVAVLLGVVATLWLLLVPSYAWRSESQTAGGFSSSSATGGVGTLLEANGPSALIPLLVPIALLVPPVVGRRAAAHRAITRASAILLTAFVVVASLSIGLMFLPGAIALWVAVPGASSAARPPNRRAAGRRG